MEKPLSPQENKQEMSSGRALAFSFPSLMPTHSPPEKGSASRPGLGGQGRGGHGQAWALLRGSASFWGLHCVRHRS